MANEVEIILVRKATSFGPVGGPTGYAGKAHYLDKETKKYLCGKDLDRGMYKIGKADEKDMCKKCQAKHDAI